MKTYGVGIAGFGWVAGAHLKSFTMTPGFAPVAIYSRRQLDPKAIEAEYGVKVKIYNSYEQMLDDPRVEVVDICTPHPYHPEQAIQAARTGRHLIIEKPIALKFEDAVAMLEAVEKAGVHTSVCFEVRVIGVAQAMKSIIAQGLIGEVYYGECDYYHGIGPWYQQYEWNVKKDMGGSSLLTAGCHALDTLLWLTGKPVEEVFSYPGGNPHEAYAPYEYDTTTVTLLRFADGRTLGKVASVIDCMQPYVFNMNILGSHGTLKNDLFYSKKIPGLQGWSKLDVQLVDSGDVAHHPYRQQFESFHAALELDVEPDASLASAFESHRVVFAADRSAATGKPVALSEFRR